MARLKLFIPLIIFLVLAAFLLRGLSIDPTELPSALKDRPFPEFNLTDLAEPSRRLTLDDVKGQVALVNVFPSVVRTAEGVCPRCDRDTHQKK